MKFNSIGNLMKTKKGIITRSIRPNYLTISFNDCYICDIIKEIEKYHKDCIDIATALNQFEIGQIYNVVPDLILAVESIHLHLKYPLKLDIKISSYYVNLLDRNAYRHEITSDLTNSTYIVIELLQP